MRKVKKVLFSGALPVLMGGGGAAAPYDESIISMFGANLVSYLKLDETSGATAADSSGHSTAGAYLNVDLANALMPTKIGGSAPLFGGTDGDAVNWYSAALVSNFDPLEGTLIAWVKAHDAGVWTDAAERGILVIRDDASNRVNIYKAPDANTLSFVAAAGGTVKTVADTSLGGSTAWFMVGLTWSKTADQVKAYINGSQVGDTQTGLGIFVGPIIDGRCNVGASVTTSAAWNGWIGHAILLIRVATPTEMGLVWSLGNP